MAAWSYADDRSPAVASESVRYADPATEFTVYRLTSPSHTSYLPSCHARAVSRRGTFLIYSSDRTGSFQPFRMELKSGVSRQIGVVEGLDPASLALMPDEKSCCLLAGTGISLTPMAGGKAREVYRAGSGYSIGGLCVNDDGLYAAFVEWKDGRHRVRLLNFIKGTASTVAESAEPISEPVPRPGRAGLLYRVGDSELHVVNFDGAHNQRLKTAAAGVGPALWSRDGRNVLYLSVPPDRSQLVTLREHTPDSNEDRAVSPTTQYAHFGRNADSTVFAGASGSKASPYLLLLVRSVKRELTLCEHKASDPRMVAPIFSPNSQRVFFQTDRHGKPAIYSMAVDKLVEETE